jgi:hypothetical protein
MPSYEWDAAKQSFTTVEDPILDVEGDLEGEHFSVVDGGGALVSTRRKSTCSVTP